MKLDLKSILSLIITVALAFAFCFVVITLLDEEMAKSIVTTFLTIATSVLGFFIGYQTNKPTQSKTEQDITEVTEETNEK